MYATVKLIFFFFIFMINKKQNKSNKQKRYGNLYKKMISTTGEIPIGLYRTKQQEITKNTPVRVIFIL